MPAGGNAEATGAAAQGVRRGGSRAGLLEAAPRASERPGLRGTIEGRGCRGDGALELAGEDTLPARGGAGIYRDLREEDEGGAEERVRQKRK